MVKRSREETENSSSSDADLDTATASNRPGVSASEHHDITKYIHVDTGSGEEQSVTEVMRCFLPPHRQPVSFLSFDDYDVHYNKVHVNRCIECRKNFPTSHFLNLHQEENHDPLIEALRARGERTYSCFVEDCDRKCSTAQKRRLHLIDKHMFPKDYDFYIVNDGIDQRSSMLRSGRHRRQSSAANKKIEIDGSVRRRVSTLSNIPGEVITDIVEIGNSEERHALYDFGQEHCDPTSGCNSPRTDDDHMSKLTGAMSALTFVPPSVRFGRDRGKGRGFSRS